MEKNFKNTMSFEEAVEIWNADTDVLFSDHIVVYEEPKNEETSIIGIDDPNDNKVDITLKIVAVGEKVTNVKSGDKVLLHPGMFMGGSIANQIGDCLFWITPERAVIKKCK